jgi:hypothetical protein
MFEQAEQELHAIQALLAAPTPDNFQAVNRKLESLIPFFGSLETSLSANPTCDQPLREFLTRLPVEMSHIRILLEGPLNFFRGLNESRALKFGSYDQTGRLTAFDMPAGTSIQL